MCKDSEKDCNTCRHNPGCLKKGLAVFLLFIQTGRDREPLFLSSYLFYLIV